MENWRDGGIKLLVISKLLALRAAEAELFASGEYEPLLATGGKAERVCAFLRRRENRRVLVLAARFSAQAEADQGWAETSLNIDAEVGAGLRNVFTGDAISLTEGAIDLSAAFGKLPVAVFAPAA
jgi:(1->4)-alpha-D-glucan 1-alpha-D-glucosylmutase